MLVTSLLLSAFVATGLAQAPEGYRTVYITSMVNNKFVVVPKARTAGSTLVMCVCPIVLETSVLILAFLI
jgi:hypothetical protein